MKQHLLFVCSRNQWRSPTAEGMLRNHPDIDARSAGTSDSAKIKLNEKLLLWADVVLVMEKRHGDIIRQRYPHLVDQLDIRVLDIPDDYQLNDPELVELLEDRLKDML